MTRIFTITHQTTFTSGLHEVLKSLEVNHLVNTVFGVCRYDPVNAAAPESTVVAMDEALVQAYFELPDEEMDVNRMSAWLLRIELDR